MSLRDRSVPLQSVRAILRNALQTFDETAALSETISNLRRATTLLGARVAELSEIFEAEHNQGDLLADEVNALARFADGAEHLPTPALIDRAALALLRGEWELAARALSIANVEPELGPPLHNAQCGVAAAICADPDALGILEDTVRALSRWPDARRLRGAFLVLLGRKYLDVACLHLAAATFHESAHVLDRRDPEATVALAETLRRMGRAGEAHDRIGHLPDTHPARAGAHLVLARLAEDDGRWAAVEEHSAAAVLRLVAATDPLVALERLVPVPSGTASFALAKAIEARRPSVALAALDHALQLPIRGIARYAEADAYELRGLLRSAERDPRAADDHFEAGRRLTWRGAFSDAISSLHDALRLRPGFSLAAFQLADALRMLHQTLSPDQGEAALPLLMEARAMSALALEWEVVTEREAWALSSRAFLLNSLAVIDRSMEERWEAVCCAERAVLLAPMDGYHRATLARLLRALGLEWSACALSALGIERAPTNPFVVEEQLMSLAFTNEPDEAIKLLPHINDNAWRRGVEGFLLVRAAQDRTQLENASKHLEATLSNDRGEPWVRLAWAACLRRLGLAADARTQCQLALDGLSETSTGETVHMVEARFWTEQFHLSIEAATAGLADGKDAQEITFLKGLAHLALGEVALGETLLAGVIERSGAGMANALRICLEEEAPALRSFGDAEQADVRAVRMRAIEGFRESSRRQSPITPMQEVEAQLAAAPPGCRMQRTALLLAKARLLRRIGGTRARAEAHALMSEVAECQPATASDGRRRLDELASDEILEALREHELNHALTLLEAHLPLIGADPERRAGWHVRKAAVLACDPTLELCQVTAEFEGAKRETSDEHLPVSNFHEWLTCSAQAARLAEAATGLAPAVVAFIEMWLPQHLGMAASRRITSPAISVFVPFLPQAVFERFQLALTERQAASAARWGIELPTFAVRFTSRQDEAFVVVRGVRVATFALHGECFEEALAGRIVDAIDPHLADVVGIQEVAKLVDLWGGVGPQFLIQRFPHLARLTRVVRAVLRERVPVVNWRAVAGASVQYRDHPLQDQVAYARRKLFGSLTSELRPEVTIAVPRVLEDRIAARLDVSGTDRCFTAAPEEVQSILEEVDRLVGAGTRSALVVESEAIRPWLSQLAALARPGLAVVSANECARAAWPEPSAAVTEEQ